jgi:hypothetical protein
MRGTQARDDAMIEPVHGVSVRGRPPCQGGDEQPVECRVQRLDLHPHLMSADGVQGLIEERDRLAVGEPVRSHPCNLQVADAAEAWNVEVVMDHEGAIGGAVDIELNAVGAQRDRPAERREAVLRLARRGTAVADDTGADGHACSIPLLATGGSRLLSPVPQLFENTSVRSRHLILYLSRSRGRCLSNGAAPPLNAASCRASVAIG